MKRRFESKDIPMYENVAKCEHPCHSYTNERFGMIGCIFAENGPLECGIEVSFIGAGWDSKGNFRWVLAFTHALSKGPPLHFRKHMPWGISTAKLGMIGCVFVEKWLLESGFLAGLYEDGRRPYGDMKWIFGLYPCIFEGKLYHFSKAHSLRYWHRRFGNDGLYIRGEWAFRKWHWSNFQLNWLGC